MTPIEKYLDKTSNHLFRLRNGLLKKVEIVGYKVCVLTYNPKTGKFLPSSPDTIARLATRWNKISTRGKHYMPKGEFRSCWLSGHLTAVRQTKKLKFIFRDEALRLASK